MKTVVLLDLDGTLTDTADMRFKEIKDGKSDFDVKSIPLFDGAIDFVYDLKKKDYEVFVVSDSHPRYVSKIVNYYFSNTKFLSLADKPNMYKTKDFLISSGYFDLKSINLFVIGDTWLDITLGRAFEAYTVLIDLYKSLDIQIRDGIGDSKKNWKSGPTFYAKNYTDVLNILDNKVNYLFSGEAAFQNIYNHNAILFYTERSQDRIVLYRSLARQQQGNCDSFAIADKYFEFSRENRSSETLKSLSLAVEEYLKFVISFKYKWDYFTYIPDKDTTVPKNKMQYFFNEINLDIEKINIFKWSNSVVGSTRQQININDRTRFVSESLKIIDNIELTGKSIIVLDDQITTGATADVITKNLIKKGVKNIIFLALFNLIDKVDSQKLCPKCGKKLQLKINRSNGKKFYSCVLPKYKGDGCGFLENIDE